MGLSSTQRFQLPVKPLPLRSYESYARMGGLEEREDDLCMVLGSCFLGERESLH